MGTIKDIYDILRNSVSDLKDLAKKAKNQDMLELAIDIQDKVFEIKDEMQNLKDENLELRKKLEKNQNALDGYQNKLREYEIIKSKLANYESNKEDIENLANLKISLDFTEIHYIYTSDTIVHKKKIDTNLADIFKVISLKMMTQITKDEFVNSFSLLCGGYYLDEKQALQIKAQLLSLELIELSLNRKDEETIKLTQKGIKEMQRLNKEDLNG